QHSIRHQFNEFSHPGMTEAVADFLHRPQISEADTTVRRKFRGSLADRSGLFRLPTGLAFPLDQLAFVDGDDLSGHLTTEVGLDEVLNLGRHGLVAEFCQRTPHGFRLVGQLLERLAVARLVGRSASLFCRFCLCHICLPPAANYRTYPTVMMPDRPTNMQGVR